MKYSTGIDMSLRSASICVVDATTRQLTFVSGLRAAAPEESKARQSERCERNVSGLGNRGGYG
jgi:hypothetical protein